MERVGPIPNLTNSYLCYGSALVSYLCTLELLTPKMLEGKINGETYIILVRGLGKTMKFHFFRKFIASFKTGDYLKDELLVLRKFVTPFLSTHMLTVDWTQTSP